MLVGAINSTVKIIKVDNPNNFSPQGPFVVKIEAEQMLVTQTAGSKFQVNRGYNGTTAATHANGKTVVPIITNVIPAAFIQNVNQ